MLSAVGLFAWKRRRKRRIDLPIFLVPCEPGFPLEVRGESYRQAAIARLVEACGPEQTAHDRCRCEIRVQLRREPGNPVDPNAVQVLSLADELLGYLPRELAGEYSRVLRLVDGRLIVRCDGCAYGRLHRGDGWNFGIWLGVPSAAQLKRVLLGVNLEPVTRQ